jgi:hypothetical protein
MSSPCRAGGLLCRSLVAGENLSVSLFMERAVFVNEIVKKGGSRCLLPCFVCHSCDSPIRHSCAGRKPACFGKERAAPTVATIVIPDLIGNPLLSLRTQGAIY